MNITLKDANNIQEVFSNFLSQKLPIKLSYKIMKLSSSLENELEFYKNQLADVIQTYAARDEENEIIYLNEGQNIKIQEDKIEEFNEKYNELTYMDIEIPDYYFTLDELSTLELTPMDLYKIDCILIDEFEVKSEEAE